jgi:hypothetical protein
VFLGQTEGLAMLTINGAPLGWRPFALTPGIENIAILSGARTLWAQSRHYNIETPLEYVMIHGRPDLHDSLQKSGLPTELGARVIWHEGPEDNGATVARGLALGCLNQNAPGFDLSRLMKPRAALRDIFPWGELACQGAVITLMGLALFYESSQLDTAYAAARAECNRNKILASATPLKLMDEKKALTQKLDAIHSFLDTRMLWTAYARDVSTLLPPNMLLTEFQGASAFGGAKGAGGARTFTIGAEVPVTGKGEMPREIGDLLVGLRNHPHFKLDFPSIRLSGIRQTPMKGEKEAMEADFTIVCQPDGGTGKGGGK